MNVLPLRVFTSSRLSFMRLMLLALALLVAGCSDPESPEQRIRALIEGAEEAAENKESRTLRSYISDDYADKGGRDRHTIDGILRLYLLRHQAIHLLTRITDIAFPEPRRATAAVYVAMAGRPITGPQELAALRASLYRFELGFAEEDGEWRVISAAWRPAEPVDFIYRRPDT